MPFASFSMLDGPGGTGCKVPVHSCWDSRDVIVAAVFELSQQLRTRTLQPVPPGPSGIEKLLLKSQVS